MKKKAAKIFTSLLLPVPCPVYALEQTTEAEQQINASDLSNVLISFLYLAAVLALIYVILILIDKHAKKHNHNQKQEPEKNASDQISDASIEKEATESKDGESDE